MMSIRSLAAGAVAALIAGSALAADPVPFRISLNTGPNHVRNISLEKFITTLTERTAGRLDVQLYPSAQLFKGPDVPKVLAQGALEMGVPIISYVSSIVPNAGIGDLPMFYGRSSEEVHGIFDGPIGQELNAEIESKLRVKVLGPVMDLGYASMFSKSRPLNEISDVKGLKMRVPGSPAATARYTGLEAQMVSIPFSDVPLALSQGTIDGLMTTHESVRSAKLWDSGLRYAIDDQQIFFVYIPMVSQKIWEELDEDLRDIVVRTWNETIGDARALAASRQRDARAEGQQNGITSVAASAAEIAAQRAKLMQVQDDVIGATGIDAGFAGRVAQALGN